MRLWPRSHRPSSATHAHALTRLGATPASPLQTRRPALETLQIIRQSNITTHGGRAYQIVLTARPHEPPRSIRDHRLRMHSDHRLHSSTAANRDSIRILSAN
jgi:hypothetical protein